MFNFTNKINTAPLGNLHLFSLGQAGFIIKTASGKLIGIDLYLSDCVECVEPDTVGYKRLLPKILEPGELVLDAVICTHFHRDHYDVDSIPGLMDNGHTMLYCPEDCRADVEEQGLDKNRVQFVSPGSSFDCGDYVLRFVNCDHGTGAPLAVGGIIEADGIRILEAGDTCLRLDRAGEYTAYGKVDVLIAPINGMYGNMNAAECAELADAIRPGTVIPCHYGMFAAHMGSVGEFHRIMDEKYPDIKYLLMGQGEEFTLKGDL